MSSMNKKEWILTQSWIKVCEWNHEQIYKNAANLSERIRKEKGILNHCRWAVWRKLLDLRQMELKVDYNKYLTMEVNEEDNNQILLDIPRTFPELQQFSADSMQKKLYNVLRAIANYDKEVGFCQGMSYITGMLLTVMSEQDTFQILVVLYQKYDLRKLFISGFPKLRELIYIFESQLKRKERRLFTHLQKHGVETEFYAPKWFLTLYCLEFDLHFVIKIWDLFLLNGWLIVCQVALALMSIEAKKFMAMSNIESITEHFSLIPKLTRSSEYQKYVLSRLKRSFKEREMNMLIQEYCRSKEKSKPGD
jgi:hypothetical protein